MASGGDKHKVDCEVDDPSRRDRKINFFRVDLALRALALAFLAAALANTTTGNQLERVGDSDPLSSSEAITLAAKFTYSPAVIYFIVAVVVAILYAVLTAVVSAVAIPVPAPSTKLLLLLVLFDAVMAGVVASATGAVASLAYVALKGNDHIGWTMFCDVFGKFCRHLGSAVVISLAASVVFVLLVGLSAYSLHRRSLEIINPPIDHF